MENLRSGLNQLGCDGINLLMGCHLGLTMSGGNSTITNISLWLVGIGFGLVFLVPGLGIPCCMLGVFGLVSSSLISAGSATSSDGKMVLKQTPEGEWNWVSIAESAENFDPAAQFNNPDNQILSRLIKQVREGKSLDELPNNEFDILASAYGVESGSRAQKTRALMDSEVARKGLKMAAIGAAGGIATAGASRIVKSGRQRAIERAEELRQQGVEKLQENIEQGKYKIDSAIPQEITGGESATDFANNIVLDQLSKEIREKNLTPSVLMGMADANGDGKLEPREISVALAKATGLTVPVFIIKESIKEFDLNTDGLLDLNELEMLWRNMGIDLQEETIPDSEILDIDDEIESTFAEIDSEPESQEPVIEPETKEYQDEPQVLPTHEEPAQKIDSGERTEGIDSDFERLIIQMEEARFSSDRRALMDAQTSEFLVSLRIDKVERTLIGDSKYRGGKSLHALIDGGPYSGVVKVPVSFNDQLEGTKKGDEIKAWVKLVDFSPSLKRPVVEASEIV